MFQLRAVKGRLCECHSRYHPRVVNRAHALWVEVVIINAQAIPLGSLPGARAHMDGRELCSCPDDPGRRPARPSATIRRGRPVSRSMGRLAQLVAASAAVGCCGQWTLRRRREGLSADKTTVGRARAERCPPRYDAPRPRRILSCRRPRVLEHSEQALDRVAPIDE